MLKLLVLTVFIVAHTAVTNAFDVISSRVTSPSISLLSMTSKADMQRSQAIPFLSRPKFPVSYAGDAGFDILGLAELSTGAGLDLYWLREAELKHSRVAMLSIIGLLLPELGFRIPHAPTSSNQIDTFWTLVKTSPQALIAGFIFIGIIELASAIAITNGRKVEYDRSPGDYSFNPLGFGKSTRTRNDLSLKEIKNGRLAMIASIGILYQESIKHIGAIEALSASSSMN